MFFWNSVVSRPYRRRRPSSRDDGGGSGLFSSGGPSVRFLAPAQVRRNLGARPGDAVVLGKPLGVGVMSAALKKGELDAAGYSAMIAATTRLNTPGPDLAALRGVHALTDVTGFGLAGHALEMARGSRCALRIDWAQVPLLPGARALAVRGLDRKSTRLNSSHHSIS